MATAPDDFDATAADYGVDEDAYVPEGWDTPEAFLSDAREKFQADVDYDRANRDWALEDLEFTAGNQWDPAVKEMREEQMRPCLTINVLPQFVGQVIGDRRLNKTTIKVRPFRDGDVHVADVRSGLIKSIELYSRAERAYDAACEDQVTCGISALRVDLDYAANDVFDQDIFIRHVPNPLAVVWDRMSVDPTGKDAQRCFVIDRLPKKEYEKRFPDYPCPTGFVDEGLNTSEWWDSDSVQICEYWEMIEKPALFAMMHDGDVKDVTDLPEEEYVELLWRDPRTGAPKLRKSYRTFARMHLVCGFAILEGPYELPLDRLPIIRVEGRVVRVGDDRVRFGLIRFAKDSQRLKNYWRSVAAESLALAPKAQWVGPEDAFEGREAEWERNHLASSTLLTYNKNASEAPQRLNPPPVPAALLQESQLNQQDIKDTTGLHDASLGMRSNEVSGRAIEARKSEGDVATVIYHDNLNHAIQEVGAVVNQLIPIAYDTVRTVRVIGEDDEHKLKVINDPEDEDSPDVTKGKYDVVLETGPSFSTQRREALDAMFKLIQTSPELMGVIGDLVAKYMDWPGAYEIYERLRKTPGIQQFIDPEEKEEGKPPSPEKQMQMQQMQMQQQAAQQAMEMEMEQKQLELEEQRAKAAQAAAQAEESAARVRQANAQAVEAEAKADRAAIEARMAPTMLQQKMRLAERSASAKAPSNNRGAPTRRPKKDAPRKEQP
jgi:hypothetical protein